MRSEASSAYTDIHGPTCIHVTIHGHAVDFSCKGHVFILCDVYLAEWKRRLGWKRKVVMWHYHKNVTTGREHIPIHSVTTPFLTPPHPHT